MQFVSQFRLMLCVRYDELNAQLVHPICTHACKYVDAVVDANLPCTTSWSRKHSRAEMEGLIYLVM